MTDDDEDHATDKAPSQDPESRWSRDQKLKLLESECGKARRGGRDPGLTPALQPDLAIADPPQRTCLPARGALRFGSSVLEV